VNRLFSCYLYTMSKKWTSFSLYYNFGHAYNSVFLIHKINILIEFRCFQKDEKRVLSFCHFHPFIWLPSYSRVTLAVEFSWIFTFWTCAKISVHVSFWVKIEQNSQPLHMKTCMLSWRVSVIGFHYFKQRAVWRRGWVWRNSWRSRSSTEICPFTIPWSWRSIYCNRLMYQIL
jgi:hypothetical protein